MSLDYALEKYPAPVKLRDGTDCILRPHDHVFMGLDLRTEEDYAGTE